MKKKSKYAEYSMIRIPLLLLLFGIGSLAYSQQPFVVTGTVSDHHGEPLTGAVVKTVDSATGTTTGVDGKYSIAVPGASSVLSFAYMGYVTVQVTVGNRKTVDVTMTENTQEIDEVVVIGYGTARKRDLVGAVGYVSGKSLAERANMNISRSLQGAVPGLGIVMRDGKPSRGATLDVRGKSSIGQGGGPLILIDGTEAHGDLTTVNPSDIESISVLKDASSAAIYGARGAFGVILITTKSPDKGKPKVNYNGSVSVHRRLFEPERVTDGLQWTDGWYKAYVNSQPGAPNSINNVFKYSDEWYRELVKRSQDPTLEKVRVNAAGEYEYFGNTDWFDIIYKDHNVSTEHNLSVSGGDDRVRYAVSGRYFNQEGIYTAGNEDYTQYNFRAKGSLKINRYLTVDNNTDFIKRSVHQPMVMYDRQNILRQMEHQGYPMTMPKNPDGTWTEAAVYTGWAGFVEGTSFQHNNKFDLRSTTTLTYTPIEQLILKADYSYYFNHSERDRAENMYRYYTGPALSAERNTFNSLEHISNNGWYQSSNITASWLPKFEDTDHRLNVLWGINMDGKKTKNITAYRRGVLLPEMPTFHLMDGEVYTIDQGGIENSYFGLLYRVNYIFRDRYLAEFSGRYDGSSKFPPGQLWGFFPSLSLGWRMSEEPFMNRSRGWIDNFKFRVSAGSLGNSAIDEFAFLPIMAVGRTGAIIGNDRQAYAYAAPNIPVSLTWETNTTYDAGLDIDALSNRLNFIFDYYHRYTTDMFTAGPELPAVFGDTSPKGNNADMKTRGWEVSLQWRDRFPMAGKPFSYHVRGMLWDSRSWITKFNNPNKNLGSGHTASYYEGMEIGEVWGYRIEGLFRDQADISSHADQSAIRVSSTNILMPGDLKYADLDHSGVINRGANTVDDPGDRCIIGNTSPRCQFGLSLGASWNGIGVSAFIQGIGRKHWYPYHESAFFWGQYNRPYSYMLKMHTGDNVWSEENLNFDAYWPRYRGYIALNENTAMRTVNDRYLQNVAYVRLKSLQVDYTFGRKICDFLHLSDLRIYVAGDNIFTWSPLFRVTRNFDPEGIFPGDSDFRSTAGTDGDGYGYPVQGAWTFGINLTF